MCPSVKKVPTKEKLMFQGLVQATSGGWAMGGACGLGHREERQSDLTRTCFKKRSQLQETMHAGAPVYVTKKP